MATQKIKPKRTRKGHKPECPCGVCNKKRMKAERLAASTTPPLVEPDSTTIAPAETPHIVEPQQAPAPIETPTREITAEEKEAIIKEYLENLPNDRAIVVFEKSAIDALGENFNRLKEKYPDCETADKLGTKMVNECVSKYCKYL